MSKFTVLFLSAVFMAGVGTSNAGKDWDWHEKHGECGEKYERHNKRDWGKHLSEKLGLTEEQQKQLKEQREKNDEERRETGKQLKEKYADLKTAIKEDKIDDKKVDKIIDEISELRKQQLKRRIQSLRELKEVLTKEQWKKFRHMERSRRQHRKDRD